MQLDALGPAGEKLRNVLSPKETESLLDEAVATLGSDLSSPQQRYLFGELLTTKERAVLRIMGRSIMAQAVLHGARDPSGRAP